MLLSLSIRDVVLIDRLDLSFEPSLSVLTGETGAGKSILLDSLSLALGARSDAGMVRPGAERLTVTAAFDPPTGHPARGFAAEQGVAVAADEPLVLRRQVGADGRSRATINDQAVSVGLLRQVGDLLVEIHGQFENHGLMDPATHLGVLDAYGAADDAARACRAAFTAWRAASEVRAKAEADLAKARADEELLRHDAEELDGLSPKLGEEKDLDDRRRTMMHAEKLGAALGEAQAALAEGHGIEGALARAQGAIDRVAHLAGESLKAAAEALERALIEAGEAVAQVDKAASEIEIDPQHLERIEDRLFTLRGVARKHGVAVDDLAALRDDLHARLRALDGGGDDLARLTRAADAARSAYLEAARALSKARHAAARRLDDAVAVELEPLKLGAATFRTTVEDVPEGQWSADGLDRVAFEVSTNPGMPPGPIGKVASGGELARFMLALKVVLAGASPIPTLVFDEVDTGIGGATASAVGERLARLGRSVQVLVVTHSPQVAALGAHHMKVAKAEVEPGRVRTSVARLSAAERREEIARMLSGEAVTDQARAAAAALIGGSA